MALDYLPLIPMPYKDDNHTGVAVQLYRENADSQAAIFETYGEEGTAAKWNVFSKNVPEDVSVSVPFEEDIDSTIQSISYDRDIMGPYFDSLPNGVGEYLKYRYEQGPTRPELNFGPVETFTSGEIIGARRVAHVAPDATVTFNFQAAPDIHSELVVELPDGKFTSDDPTNLAVIDQFVSANQWVGPYPPEWPDEYIDAVEPRQEFVEVIEQFFPVDKAIKLSDWHVSSQNDRSEALIEAFADDGTKITMEIEPTQFAGVQPKFRMFKSNGTTFESGYTHGEGAGVFNNYVMEGMDNYAPSNSQINLREHPIVQSIVEKARQNPSYDKQTLRQVAQEVILEAHGVKLDYRPSQIRNIINLSKPIYQPSAETTPREPYDMNTPNSINQFRNKAHTPTPSR